MLTANFGATLLTNYFSFPPSNKAQKDKEKVTYVHVDTEKAKKIVEEHIKNGRVVAEYTIGR